MMSPFYLCMYMTVRESTIGPGRDEAEEYMREDTDPVPGHGEPGEKRGESVEVQKVERQPKRGAYRKGRGARACNEERQDDGEGDRKGEMDQHRHHQNAEVEGCRR